VLEAAADRGERGLDVLHHLHDLGAEAIGDLAAGVDGGLAGEIDSAVRANDLDHVAVARRARHARGVREAQVRSLRLRAARRAGGGRDGHGSGNEFTARRVRLVGGGWRGRCRLFNHGVLLMPYCFTHRRKFSVLVYPP
jgi:hypothetical protein